MLGLSQLHVFFRKGSLNISGRRQNGGLGSGFDLGFGGFKLSRVFEPLKWFLLQKIEVWGV